MDNLITAPIKKVSKRSCPDCGYIISQDVAELMARDYLCPRCQNHKYSEFEIKEFGPVHHG